MQVEFRERIPDRGPPAKRTIQGNVSKYHPFVTSLDRNKGNSGMSRSARKENIALEICFKMILAMSVPT